MKNKTVLNITLSKLIELVVLLLIISVLNLIKFDSLVNLQVAYFLNQNLEIIIIFSVLFYLGELFSIFKFPFNTPAPLFNATGGMFLAGFIFQLLYKFGELLNQDIFYTFKLFEPLAFTLVFLIVIIFGYIRIFINLNPKFKEKQKLKIKKKSKMKQNDISWKDVGDEFKIAAYNLASTIKKSLEPKKTRKK